VEAATVTGSDQKMPFWAWVVRVKKASNPGRRSFFEKTTPGKLKRGGGILKEV
jgi:hypothetical protein